MTQRGKVNFVSNPEKALRELILNAVIDGELGTGLVVTRQQVMEKFKGKFADNYLSTILANSEMGAKTSGYPPFTIRIADGKYQIHPVELLYRMRDRELI
jgi:hypothetical protein